MKLAHVMSSHLLRCEALDAADRLRGRHDPLVPPRRMVFVGTGDYRATGDEFFRYFQAAGLEPGDDVLDVGCGIGRMARPLAGWLTGSYSGFDIVRSGVEWCQANIAVRYPNFSFSWVDVYNGSYNPGGTDHPGSFRFPYADESFEFAFLTSVFTHMTPPGILNYLSELRRVLRPGGAVLATYFLLERESRENLAAGRSEFDFSEPHPSSELGEYLTLDHATTEWAVAVDRRRVEAAHARVGLPIREVRSGRWSGRPDGLSLQDITVSTAVGPEW